MVRVRVFNTLSRYPLGSAETIRITSRVLKGESRMDADMNIVYIGDRRMREMHGAYLHDRTTTDVLSFSLLDDDANPRLLVEGEVYVNIEQARRQARKYRVSIANELARLVIHGTLHLIGYDDRTKRLKEKMTRRENMYLTSMNYEPT